MIAVKVLGSGCKKCHLLEQKVRELAACNNIETEITKVTELAEIMKYGILMTPGLVINEKVKSSGMIPKEEQIVDWLKEG